MAAVDPNILRAMMNYQQDPGLDFADEDVLSDQGKMLTQLSKYGNAGTDLDSMLMLGGIQPGAYDPITTLDPVEAPGARQLAQMRTGGPYQKWLAAETDAGKKPNQILLDIQKIIADPTTHPSGSLIVGDLPTQMIQPKQGGPYVIDPAGTPDVLAIRDEIEGLHKAINSDPDYQMVNGQPMSATTKDSPARQALLDAGIVSDPQAGYDPYMFAPSGVTPESDAKIADTLKRWGPVNEARDTLYQTAATDASAADEAYRKFLTPRSPEDIAAREAARQVEAEPKRMGGIAGILDALPGDSAIAGWMNGRGGRRTDAGGPPQPPGRDTSRDKIPQRGGIADDAARIVEHPGKSIFGWAGDRISDIADLPGNVSQIPGAVDRWTEGAAGAADRSVGNPAEGFLSGNIGISNDESYMNDDTNTFRLPDWLTGNKPDLPGGGPPRAPGAHSLLDQNWVIGQQTPDRTVAGLPGASAGGGQQAPQPGGGDIMMQLMAESLKKKMLAAQAQQHKMQLQKDVGIQKFKQASMAQHAAARHQAQRQSISDMLASQGRSPLQDELNARKRLIFGG